MSNNPNSEGNLIEETGHSLLTTTTYHGRTAIIKRAKQQPHQTAAQTLARWRNEVDILRKLTDHRHITQIFASDESNLTIVLRHEPGRSLDKFVDGDTFSTLSREDAKVLLKGMVSALAHLHSMGIVHDDVKADNIMWISTPTHESSNNGKGECASGHPVLIDFGAAFDQRKVGAGYFVPNGTPSWTPPEFLARRKGKEGDVWGLGVVMVWALGLCGLPDGEWILPWALEQSEGEGGKDWDEMRGWLGEVEGLRGRVREMGDGEWGVVARMLVADPDGRISSKKLVGVVEEM